MRPTSTSLPAAASRFPTGHDSWPARAMRGLIIDHARSRRAMKRGSQFESTSLDAELVEDAVDERELTRVSEALDQIFSLSGSLTVLNSTISGNETTGPFGGGVFLNLPRHPIFLTRCFLRRVKSR